MQIARDSRWRGLGLRAAVRVRGTARTLLRRPRPLPPASGVSRIAVVKRRGLGALVCATPALRALRERYPDAELLLLTTPALQPLYEDSPLGLRPRALPETGPGRIRRVVSELLQDASGDPAPPRIAIDLDGNDPLSRSAVWASGAAFTAGLVPSGRWGLDASVRPDPDRHAAEVYCDIAAAAGADCPGRLLLEAPYIREAEHARVAEWLDEWRVPEGARLVAISMSAGAFAPRRAWPGEKFILLAQALEETVGCRTIFLGTPEDETYVVRHLKNMDSPCVNLTGQTSVRQLAALLARVELLVTNDAGPLHLAAALGTPTVSIYGPGSPRRFGPPDTEQHAVIYQEPACGGCVDFLTGHLGRCRSGEHCVRDIPLETVRRTVLEMLDHLEEPETPPWTARNGTGANEHRPRKNEPGPEVGDD